jgi:hypothetical protein
MTKKYYLRSPSGKKVRVNSKVVVGKIGSARWKSYCARSGAIKGEWKRNKDSPNWLQRRRWKCGYVEGEVKA